jgi:hypothetical protein
MIEADRGGKKLETGRKVDADNEMVACYRKERVENAER